MIQEFVCSNQTPLRNVSAFGEFIYILEHNSLRITQFCEWIPAAREQCTGDSLHQSTFCLDEKIFGTHSSLALRVKAEGLNHR